MHFIYLNIYIYSVIFTHLIWENPYLLGTEKKSCFDFKFRVFINENDL